MPITHFNPIDLGFGIGGPDPGSEYTGNSLEDFYDYLMTPRQYQSWSGSGRFRTYGPSRYATVRPEDAAMGREVLGQISARDEMAAAEELRRSELGRRQAADEMMRESRGYGGGTMSMGEGPAIRSEEIKGRAGTPIDMDDPVTRAVLYGGGYSPDPERQAEAYAGGRRTTGQPTQNQVADLLAKRDAAVMRIEQGASGMEGWEGLDPDVMLEKVAKEGWGAVPWSLREALNDYFEIKQKAMYLTGGGQSGEAPVRQGGQWTP